MKAGLSAQGKALTLSSMFEAVGAFKEGTISKEAFLDMEQNACPHVVRAPVCLPQTQ